MENYPPNSHKAKDGVPAKKAAKPPAKKIEKVITGEVVLRKKPLGKRFAETFFGGDAKGVLKYVLLDVLVPGMKDNFSDAVSQGVDKMLFGEVRGRSRGSVVGQAVARTAYNQFSNSRSTGSRMREDPRTAISRRAQENHDFREIVLATKVEAEEVIDGLFTLISEYEVATVADLYELLGVSGNFVDEKWGWEDIRGAGAVRVKGGYLLDLPRPVPLN